MRPRRPVEGRRVVVYDAIEGKDLEGVVQSLLSTQFTYLVDGERLNRFAFYSDKWRQTDDTTS